MINKHLLTKQQRLSGLDIIEDSDMVQLVDKIGIEIVNIANYSATGCSIYEVQKDANSYLINRAKKMKLGEYYNHNYHVVHKEDIINYTTVKPYILASYRRIENKIKLEGKIE